jgi:uncharacterized protein (TIRG00374 family)
MDERPNMAAAEAAVPDSVGNPTRATIRRLAGVAMLGGLLFLAWRTIDLERFVATLRAADLRIAAEAAILAVTVCMTACSLRLWLLTRPLPTPGPGVKWPALHSIYLASCAAHHLLPAPAAEVARTVYLRRRYGYTVGGLVASQLVEKVIEMLALGVEILLVAALAPLPKQLSVSLWLFVVIAVGGALAVAVIGWRYQPGPRAQTQDGVLGRVRAFFGTLHEAMYLLRSPRVWLLSFLCSLVNDAANAATVGLAAAAVGVPLPIGTWFLMMLVARGAGLVPSTPGQFGVVEGGLVLVLAPLGVAAPQALAIALVYHLAHFLPVTAVGLWELRRQWQEAT